MMAWSVGDCIILTILLWAAFACGWYYGRRYKP